MSLRAKISNLSEAAQTVKAWQAEDQKVVFTNGCFDLMHPGHVLYLEEARSLGDRLVVAVNSDDSVRRLKGPSRPVQNENARAVVLAALQAIDMVVIFEEDTPLKLITTLKPDMLVKGGDWSVDQIVGGAEVEAAGGEVRSIHFEEGHSTTDIIQKIRNHEG